MSTRWNSSFERRALGLAHVERDDPLDVGIGERARGSSRRPTRPAAPVTAIGRHLHTLAAWSTFLNPDDGAERARERPATTPSRAARDPGPPGLPPFFGLGGAQARRDRLLAGRPQPGHAHAAVDRSGQLGGGAPDRRMGRARGQAGAGGRRRRPRAVRGARARRADPRGRRDRSHRHLRHRRRRPSGPKGWVDLHLVALRPVLEALATTLGAAMQPEDDADDADGLDEDCRRSRASPASATSAPCPGSARCGILMR